MSPISAARKKIRLSIRKYIARAIISKNRVVEREIWNAKKRPRERRTMTTSPESPARVRSGYGRVISSLIVAMSGIKTGTVRRMRRLRINTSPPTNIPNIYRDMSTNTSTASSSSQNKNIYFLYYCSDWYKKSIRKRSWPIGILFYPTILFFISLSPHSRIE